MKKVFLILVLMVTGMCARAQYDTLGIGDREPTFFFYDTNWWDNYYLNDPYAREIMWDQNPLGSRYRQAEYARYCYTDTALRVIGVAAAYYMQAHIPSGMTYNDAMGAMIPETLTLYEVDSTTGELVRLDGKSWAGFNPRYKIINSKSPYYLEPLHIPEPSEYGTLYEVYFDSAITVHDSFYVSTTEYNLKTRDSLQSTKPYMLLWLCGINASTRDATHPYTYTPAQFLPNPNHFRRKLHNIDGEDDRYGVTDTLWHTFHTISNGYGTGTTSEFNSFLYLFPIIDTSKDGGYVPAECTTPEGLTVIDIDSGNVMLSWQGGNANYWELLICPEGSTPETGTVTTSYFDLVTVNGLDTAQWYVARVRSVCNYGEISDWSDSVMFYVPGDTTSGGEEPIRIETTVDRYTYLMPNPASETVTLASSFRIGDVEVYDLNGKQLIRQKVDGLQTALDISSLTSGTYIVRITTNNGTAYKKLVVR